LKNPELLTNCAHSLIGLRAQLKALVLPLLVLMQKRLTRYSLKARQLQLSYLLGSSVCDPTSKQLLAEPTIRIIRVKAVKMTKNPNSTIKVLIADDDRFVRQIAKIILQDAGFEQIVEASSGEEATFLFYEQKFDIALLDINMTPIDGLALTKYLRATRFSGLSNIPIVIMTTQCNRDLLMRAKQVGIDQLCLKPLSPKILLQRMEAAFSSRRAVAEAVSPKIQFRDSIYI
jgi:two-component system, chemotaxis family, chemotaxis protein CheY